MNEDDMPSKWMFSSPHSLTKTSLSCLSEDGNNVPKIGRAETRENEGKTVIQKRRSDTAPRGMSLQDKLTFATFVVTVRVSRRIKEY